MCRHFYFVLVLDSGFYYAIWQTQQQLIDENSKRINKLQQNDDLTMINGTNTIANYNTNNINNKDNNNDNIYKNNYINTTQCLLFVLATFFNQMFPFYVSFV